MTDGKVTDNGGDVHTRDWEFRSHSGNPSMARVRGLKLLKVPNIGGGGWYVSPEDAALIAAAPDLLEALGNCLVLVRLKFGNTDDGANAAQEQAYAAIAKATGQ